MSALPDLIVELERQREEAKAIGAQAPVAKVLGRVIDRLHELDGTADLDRLLTTEQAGVILGLEPATVAKRCREGRMPGAEKTSDGGEWRIPAWAVHRGARERSPRPRLLEYSA